MSTEALVRRFEAGDINPAAFSHREHVRVAHAYLTHQPLTRVLETFPAALRRFAASVGKPELYHETVTWALLMLINERMHREPGLSFEAFAARNDDLLRWTPSPLARYYRESTIDSELAKRVFVFPDRG